VLILADMYECFVSARPDLDAAGGYHSREVQVRAWIPIHLLSGYVGELLGGNQIGPRGSLAGDGGIVERPPAAPDL
jgi:hypothetical protein